MAPFLSTTVPTRASACKAGPRTTSPNRRAMSIRASPVRVAAFGRSENGQDGRRVMAIARFLGDATGDQRFETESNLLIFGGRFRTYFSK
jgi:hypothetical protein